MVKEKKNVRQSSQELIRQQYEQQTRHAAFDYAVNLVDSFDGDRVRMPAESEQNNLERVFKLAKQIAAYLSGKL